jgi:hypothetical protein
MVCATAQLQTTVPSAGIGGGLEEETGGGRGGGRKGGGDGKRPRQQRFVAQNLATGDVHSVSQSFAAKDPR